VLLLFYFIWRAPWHAAGFLVATESILELEKLESNSSRLCCTSKMTCADHILIT